LIELDIAADLAAAGYAGRVGGERSADGAAFVDIGLGAADIKARVTAAPARWRRR
jgi:hypothetical protein